MAQLTAKVKVEVEIGTISRTGLDVLEYAMEVIQEMPDSPRRCELTELGLSLSDRMHEHLKAQCGRRNGSGRSDGKTLTPALSQREREPDP